MIGIVKRGIGDPPFDAHVWIWISFGGCRWRGWSVMAPWISWYDVYIDAR